MKLFEPGKIGKLSLKNRIAMAPMDIVGLTEPDGRLSRELTVDEIERLVQSFERAAEIASQAGMDALTMATKVGWAVYPIGAAVSPSEVPHGTKLGLVLIS